MSRQHLTRRRFLQGCAAAGSLAVPYWLSAPRARAAAANDRPSIAVVGAGGRGRAIATQARQHGDIVAICDVDLKHAEAAQQQLSPQAQLYQDYRRLLERKDVEVILNATPDHWHTAINVAACRTGKDLYAEKPLTLTIEEGKILCRVVQQTGRVVQVGTQQRSEKPFQTAVELVRNGRVGKLQEVVVTLPFWTTTGGPFASSPPPAHLDWDMYQGQAPAHPYCFERTHWANGGGWRWWYDYAGGIITDWGNHHMDIAHWGMNLEHSGPLTIEGTGHFPNGGRENCYNTPDKFAVQMTYPGNLRLRFEGAEDNRNGIMFIGDRGQVFVNRGGVYGKPVEELLENPLPDTAWRAAASSDHMANFFAAVRARTEPASTVAIQHRTVTACHLANLAVRLHRKLTWDPDRQEIIGDDEANGWQRREQRAPYRIEA